MSNSWSPTSLITTADATSKSYAQQAAKYRLIGSIDPSLASTPDGLAGLANMDVDPNNLYGQLSAYKGAQVAQMSKSQMEALSPGLQRSLFSQADTVTQQALQAAGYNPPEANQNGSSGWLGTVMGDIGAAASVVKNAVSPVLDPTLQAMTEIGQVPADMYRAIRTQPQWVQELALAGAAVGTILTAGAAAPITEPLLGATLAGSLSAVPTGAAAIGGAFATAGIVNSLQGNWDFWGQAWQMGNAGERVWNDHTLGQARDLVGSDGNLTELAKTLAYNDPLEIAKQFGESNNSSDQNRLATIEKLASRAGQYGTPEYQAAYTSLDKITTDPSFEQAVATLRAGKISPGRDLARALGLGEGSTPYNVLSGLGDAAFQLTTDPLLAAGGVIKASRGVRFGVDAATAASDIADSAAATTNNWISSIDSILQNKGVLRQNAEIAALLNTDQGLTSLYQRRPDLRGILGTMLSWKDVNRGAEEWTPELVNDFYRSSAASQAFASGAAMTAKHGIIEIPHLNPLTDVMGQLREQFHLGINFLDDANISFKNVDIGDAVNPLYNDYARMNGVTRATLNMVNGIPFLNSIPQGAATLAKTLITHIPHNGFLPLTEEGPWGDQLVQEARKFFDVGRAAGLPSAVRDQAFEDFVKGQNMGLRRTVLDGYYRTLAEQSGMGTTQAGRDLIDRFVEHTHQAYIGGRNSATFAQDAAKLVAVPDIKEVRLAVAKQSLLNQTLNLADAKPLTAAVSHIWKPAVLLRVGFIPRIAGDELLSFIARHGLYGYAAGLQAQRAVEDPSDTLGWARTTASGLFTGFDKATFGKVSTDGARNVADSAINWYAGGIQKLARDGLFGLDQQSLLGKLIAPEGTVRGLVLGGIPDDYLRYAKEAMAEDSPFHQAFITRLSSRHVSVYGDPTAAESYRQYKRLNRDGQIEDLVAINPGNSRQALTDMGPDHLEWQARNQQRAIETNLTSRDVEQWHLDKPGAWVTNPLEDARFDPDSLLGQFSQAGADLKPHERYALSQLVAGSPNAQRGAAQVYLDRADYLNTLVESSSNEEQAARLMHAASKAQETGNAIRSAKTNGEALNVLGHLLPEGTRNAIGLDHMSDSWLGRVLAEGRAMDPYITRFDNYQDWRDALTSHLEDQFFKPEYQKYFYGLDDANKTAITGLPVVHPGTEGTARLWAPYLSQGARGQMDTIVQTLADLGPDNITAYMASKGVQIDEDTAKALAKMAQQEKRIIINSGSGFNEGVTTSMVGDDPRIVRKVTAALHQASGETADGIAELQAPIHGIGRFRPNHGVGGVSNPLTYGPMRGYAIDPTYVSKDAFQVFGPDVPNVDGIPGATLEQAIKESVQAHIDGLEDLHFGPRNRHPEPGSATLKEHIWWNGPKDGMVLNGQVPDRTSPIMVNNEGHIVVDPGLASADLAAGLPYWRGRGELKELPAVEHPVEVSKLGENTVGLAESGTPYTHNVHGEVDYSQLTKDAESGRPIVINVNHRNAKDASDWLDMMGANYQFTYSTRVPNWAQAKIGERLGVDQIPVRDNQISDAIAHATTDMFNRRIIEIDRDKMNLMEGSLRERSRLRQTNQDAWKILDSSDPGKSQGWFAHPSFQFMRPEDLYDELQRNGLDFEQWVVAHEMGHHAMGHIGGGITNDIYEEQKLGIERQADRWAADELGINLPTTDPRSLRLQRAAARAGVDIDKTAALMNTQGDQAYRVLLGNLESARLAYGDNLEGDVKALAHLQADWDLPVTDQGTLKIPGKPNSDQPQYLWPVTTPTKIDILHNKRGLTGSPGDIIGLDQDLVPRRAIQTVLAAQNEAGRLQKVTDWSFDKMGAAIDKIYRHPGAMYTYMKARRDADALYQSWRDPALFGEDGTFRKVAQKFMDSDTSMAVRDLSPREQDMLRAAGSKLGMTGANPWQVARSANRGGVDVLRNLGEHDAADLLQSVKAPYSVDDTMNQLLERAKSGDTSWVDPVDSATVAAAVKNDAIHAQNAHELALQRTVADMSPYIHDHRVRTQFQQYGNNLFPFWFAEDQFMRRWARTVVFDPSAIRKAQLLHMGLKNSGVIQTDDTGNEVFTYPLSPAFNEVISKIPFLHDSVPVVSALTGQLNMALPGLENFGEPSVTPFVSVPLKQVASVFPELNPVVGALTGGYDKGILRSFVPTQFMRFYDAATASDSDSNMASAMMLAAQELEAHGQGLPDNADAGQEDEYIDRLKNHARTILLAQAMFGFLVPAPPSTRQIGTTQTTNPFGIDANFLNKPEDSLKPEYLNLVRNMGVQAGTQRFLEENPDLTPGDIVNENLAWSKGLTDRESGAPLSPTVGAANFMNTNAEWMSQYKYAGPWLVPVPTADENGQPMDPTAYKEQMAMGLRKLQAPKDFIESMKFSTAAAPYFDTMDKFQALRDSAKTAAGRAQVDATKTLFQQQFYATHPIFAQQLQSSDGAQKRAQVLDEMRVAITDPATPQTSLLGGYKDMITQLDRYKAFIAQYAGRSGRAVDNQKAAAASSFNSWFEQYVTLHPEVSSFYAGIIKPEMGANG